MSVNIPEPFASGLAKGRPAEVADHPARAPEELYARGLARVQIDREEEAARDLQLAVPALGDVARIELAYLDLRRRNDLRGARTIAGEIVARAGEEGGLKARALHILGLACGRLRQTEKAVGALSEAALLYGRQSDRQGRAQVQDTLGMVYAAEGRLDLAVTYYALSLVDKTLLGDRYGMAITLGNLGRAHLRAGRLREAREALQKDLEFTEDLGGERSRGRILEDLGRISLAEGELGDAEKHLRASIEIAARHGYRDLEFFGRRDLTFVHVRRNELEQAAREFARASECCPRQGEEYLTSLLLHAEGELLLARGDDHGLKMLERTVENFAQQSLPDMEILARISLARALVARGDKNAAARCLDRAMGIVRGDGFERLRQRLSELMEELDLAEGLREESGRFSEPGTTPARHGYTQLALLGRGHFGTVYSAFDPVRSQMVAVKVMPLVDRYDTETRRRIRQMARRELEAASRVRHRGVAQVHAIGPYGDEGLYIVQDFVPGRPLSAHMKDHPRPSYEMVFELARRVAHSLGALHEMGVVHRDVKPANVIVTEDQGALHPVLVDFGIAQIGGADVSTTERVTAGTPRYMAPEQALCGLVDARTDLYALGVVCYEWLTGEMPIPLKTNLVEALDQITMDPIRPLADFRPDLGGAVTDLFNRWLAKKPRRRPQNAAQLVEELDSLCGW